MFKKMTVLAMAVGVVAALALPASASADWKHHQTAIQQNQQIGLTGNIRFQGGLGGVECQVTSAVTFEPGTSGFISSFVPEPTSDTANCKGLGGLVGCQVHNVAPTGFPWPVHTEANGSIDIEHGEIHSQSTGFFCPVKNITITEGTVVATPNEADTADNVQIHGKADVHLQTNSGVTHEEETTVSSNPTIAIEAPNANTYSI